MNNIILMNKGNTPADNLLNAVILAAQKAINHNCEVLLLSPSMDIVGTDLDRVLGEERTKKLSKEKVCYINNATFRLKSPHFASLTAEGVLLSINSGKDTFEIVDRYMKLRTIHHVIIHVAIATEPALHLWLQGKIYSEQ